MWSPTDREPFGKLSRAASSGADMHYRVYFLSSEGRIRRAEDIDAANDEDAIQFARELDHRGFSLEIWDRGRRLPITIPSEAED